VFIFICFSNVFANNCVETNLDWCTRNNGFNEGANCGARALAGTIDNIPEPGLGLANRWPRSSMMYDAISAAKAGYKIQGVKAAICCQVHNISGYSCLANNTNEVYNWLVRH